MEKCCFKNEKGIFVKRKNFAKDFVKLTPDTSGQKFLKSK